jgi:uncharacterized protein
MTDSFFHGIELVEIDDGLRPISTIRTSVVGLLGTAPGADPAAATLTTGVVANNNAIKWTADAQGEDGNDITVALVDPAGNDQALAVTLSGTAIRVSLATGAGGAISSTATAVIAAVNAHGAASALITAANAPTSSGAGLVTAVAATALSGGQDDRFPLNTPVLITSPRKIAGIGTTGSLPNAFADLYAQGVSPWIVVIRVAVGVDDAATRLNLVGEVNAGTGVRTGSYAFLDARDKLRVIPRLLIAPGWTQTKTVVDALLAQAGRLKAMVIADGPNTTDGAAITYRENFDDARLYLVDPWVRVATASGEEDRPASGRVAGMIAKSDLERGFWWSPSNRVMLGIEGASRPVVWAFNDPETQANYLNEAHVTTIIHEDGYRLWGNRTTATDPRWMFFSVRRIADMINESLIAAHLWAVDRNITKTYIEDVTEAVNAYLRRLKNVGAILGGRCWADAELNTPENIMLGRVYFDFDFTAPYPAERVTFRSHMVDDYLEEVI